MKAVHGNNVRNEQCAQAGICPLSSVQAGTVVCIKQLVAPANILDRLREMGFCEEQQIKLIRRQGNLICQVCNARLGISTELADTILVEPMPARLKAA